MGGYISALLRRSDWKLIHHANPKKIAERRKKKSRSDWKLIHHSNLNTKIFGEESYKVAVIGN